MRILLICNNIINNIDYKKEPPKKSIKYISDNNLDGLTNSKIIINKNNIDLKNYESNFNLKNENKIKKRKNSFINNNNNIYNIDIYNKNKSMEINPSDEEKNQNNDNIEKKEIRTIDKHITNKSLKIEKKVQIKINELNDEEINSLEYEQALEVDKRTFFQCYLSLIKKKQLILFTFLPSNDYNLISLKISLFLVSFSLYLTINAFFFNDDTMHKNL